VLYLGVDARVGGAACGLVELMSPRPSTVRLTVAATACGALLAIGLPSAIAAPASDGQGYVNSTARCDTQDTTVVFGSTDTSRVAICKTPGGGYEYRGVRVRDGAKLIVPTSPSGDGGFVADNHGIAYTVTASSLVVRAGSQVIREEPMVDFHGPGMHSSTTGTAAPAAPTTPTSTTPLPPPLPAEVGGGG
jgi:hypothetical protein